MTQTQVFHRHLHQTPPLAVSGKGVYLTDIEGRPTIDASGGAAVFCLGHSHPDVLAAMHAQIHRRETRHRAGWPAFSALMSATPLPHP
ncbi:MAG: aminotransferase class III-fold pyridoxal phosphate-dependent enzyme [Rhodoferax sp.]|nr:aminotransferase class III-fold pyridoxal phosphate-dependent enzyme [Rhodoferax sp.]MBP9930898.1 aminotransferase class III-fold pyridoxal phosphate-dependent enzyme [Rhodoferax sp.]